MVVLAGIGLAARLAALDWATVGPWWGYVGVGGRAVFTIARGWLQ